MAMLESPDGNDFQHFVVGQPRVVVVPTPTHTLPQGKVDRALLLYTERPSVALKISKSIPWTADRKLPLCLMYKH